MGPLHAGVGNMGRGGLRNNGRSPWSRVEGLHIDWMLLVVGWTQVWGSQRGRGQRKMPGRSGKEKMCKTEMSKPFSLRATYGKMERRRHHRAFMEHAKAKFNTLLDMLCKAKLALLRFLHYGAKEKKSDLPSIELETF